MSGSNVTTAPALTAPVFYIPQCRPERDLIAVFPICARKEQRRTRPFCKVTHVLD